MLNDPFYAPNHKPATAAARPVPVERKWTLLKTGKRVECELRFHGQSYGWECVCLYGGDLVYGRRFVEKTGALEEAEAQRQRLIGEGWTLETG
jgi:hypothetical protein